jgi:hypothetical protein
MCPQQGSAMHPTKKINTIKQTSCNQDTIQEMVVRAYHDQLLNTQHPFPYLSLLSCRFSYSEQQPPNQNKDAMDK